MNANENQNDVENLIRRPTSSRIALQLLDQNLQTSQNNSECDQKAESRPIASMNLEPRRCESEPSQVQEQDLNLSTVRFAPYRVFSCAKTKTASIGPELQMQNQNMQAHQINVGCDERTTLLKTKPIPLATVPTQELEPTQYPVFSCAKTNCAPTATMTSEQYNSTF